MKTTLPVITLVLASLPLTLHAQQGPPGPAPELKKLAVFVGTWQGSGTALMPPAAGEELAAVAPADAGGAPAHNAKWTSKSTYRWAMGGHFLEEDTIVEFENLPPMVFHAYLGWDRENRRYVSVVAANMGEVQHSELHWLGDKTVLSMGPSHCEGVPGLQRTIQRFGAAGDTIAFSMEVASADGPLMKAVEGTMKKAKGASAQAMDASLSMMPAAPEMAKLARICGTYKVEGSMVPAPGAPSMSIHGEETIRSLFGGSTVEMRVVGGSDGDAAGESPSYESWAAISWDSQARCYRQVYVDNMGKIGSSECRWSGEKALVHTMATLESGQPMAGRCVLHLADDGSIAKIVNHSLAGTAGPLQCFSATYTKK